MTNFALNNGGQDPSFLLVNANQSNSSSGGRVGSDKHDIPTHF
ncbi:hypothetical protein [Moraxella nasibovis]|nr:hypothetical protein [Moraxella nasibovis]